MSEIELWGPGSPKREFLHVDDLAQAILFSMTNSLDEHLYNVGTGEEFSIRELAKLVQNVVNHKGDILWDDSKPDGTKRKLLDNSKLEALGWSPSIKLQEGLEMTYNWFKKNQNNLREISL